jgi:hypothetical protein
MSRHRRFSTARWRALEWFHKAELDNNHMLRVDCPSSRMINLMLEAGQLERVETNLRDMPRLTLTEKGRNHHLSKRQQFNGQRRLTTLQARQRRRNRSRERQAATGPVAQEPDT